MTGKIRTLIVERSPALRNILARGLGADPGLVVVGTAADTYEALEKIVKLKPDVITLNVELPVTNGVDFVKSIMPHYPLPVVMVGSSRRNGAKAALEALDAGAVDFMTLPSSGSMARMNNIMVELGEKIRSASTVDLSHWKKRRHRAPPRILGDNPSLDQFGRKIIAIGASTGGTEALKIVLGGFFANSPAVVVVQHLPSGFTEMFAQSLDMITGMTVRVAKTGDLARKGLVLIAPADKHMTLERAGAGYMVTCRNGQRVNGHRPSVDVLMKSVAQNVDKGDAIGVMLTGMGADGAEGTLAMRNSGARTIAQDEASSLVFGMPKQAHEIGGVEALVPLEKIAPAVFGLVTGGEAPRHAVS